MKNLKYIFAIFALGFSLHSCESDGGTSVIDLGVGAITDMNKSDNYDSFLNLSELNAGNDISIGFSMAIENGDVASADLIGFYNSGGNTYGPSIIKTDVTQFPEEFVLDQNDIINAFPELNDSDDFLLGDEFVLSGKLYLNDGSEINILNDDGSNNFGSDISSSSVFSVTTSYLVSCPSDLGGTFDYVSSNLQAGYGYGCPAGEVTGTVTWEDQGGGNYLSSDLGFGQYSSSCWGDSPATSGGAIIIELCNEINPGGIGGLDQYGLTYVYKITEVNGPVMKISWTNDYADSGDVVLTRQDGKDWPALFTSN